MSQNEINEIIRYNYYNINNYIKYDKGYNINNNIKNLIDMINNHNIEVYNILYKNIFIKDINSILIKFFIIENKKDIKNNNLLRI